MGQIIGHQRYRVGWVGSCVAEIDKNCHSVLRSRLRSASNNLDTFSTVKDTGFALQNPRQLKSGFLFSFECMIDIYSS